MNKMNVSKDLCIGCGACQSICDKVFVIENDGLATTIVDEIPENLMDEAMDALESCPTSAISLVEDESKKAA